MSTILVTGASGFLGAWITARLVARGDRVIGFDLAPDPRLLELVGGSAAPADIVWETGDIAEEGAFDRAVAVHGPDRIIHLAALQIPACRADPVAAARVNVIGHINVLTAALGLGVDHVLYTSSMAAKPRGPDNAPGNLYGVLKKTDEEIARIFGRENGLSSLGLRPHIVYGVGRDVGETSVITAAMKAAARGEPYTLPFATRTCFQFADDVADIFVRAASATWQGALVSDISEVVESTDDVVAAIRAAVPEARIDVADAERLSPVSGFDVAPLRALLGDLPRTSLAEGVRRTIAHFRRLEGA